MSTRDERDDEAFLLDLLNSTPTADGAVQDAFADREALRAFALAAGGTGRDRELTQLLGVRAALQSVVRQEQPAGVLEPWLRGVSARPSLSGRVVAWDLEAEPERRLALGAVLTWSDLVRQHPGRLRPCANAECSLFLIDRSRTNSGLWCSMAVCGNRMKARRHRRRTHEESGPAPQRSRTTSAMGREQQMSTEPDAGGSSGAG